MAGFFNNDLIQEAIERQLEEENNEEIEVLDFNPLQIYFGDDYVVNNKLIIHQPTIQDFINCGESNIYDVITPFITNTTACRVQLWDMNIDWNTISNFELLSFMIKNIKIEYSKYIFGDVDLSTFELYKRNDNSTLFLYSEKENLILEEDDINKICRYIQYVFNAFPPEEEFTSSKTLKQELINNDRQKILLRKKEQQEKGTQSLLSMISFCLNHPGFKYKKNDLREICIAEFMDSVQRLQIYESTRALYNGAHSGMCDLSKVNKNEFNFMRDVKIMA